VRNKARGMDPTMALFLKKPQKIFANLASGTVLHGF
jgi:hypothetical protein